MRAVIATLPILTVLSGCDVGAISGNRREVGRLSHVVRPVGELHAVRVNVAHGVVLASSTRPGSSAAW